MIRSLLARGSQRLNLVCVAGGMGLLLAGSKVAALGLFTKGLWGLEALWREKRGFQGTWSERLRRSGEFYEGTHQDPVNRALHIVGIPIIVGGAAAMLAFPAYSPVWAAGALAFVFGWVLNFIGHGLYEKNAPAFAEDPLSFLVGPLWDLQQLRRKLGGGRPEVAVPEEARAVEEPEPVGAA